VGIAADSRPTPAAEVVVEDLGDDVTLYRASIDEVLVLNHSAGDIWRLADGELTVAEMAERLSAAYEVPIEELQPQVVEVIEDLAAHGYLAIDSDDSG
jgi:hypothetical protein